MHPGPDAMGAPASFAHRRPNAPSLPQFDLPPFQQKHPYGLTGSQTSQASGTLASVGNLLTPPSTVAGEGNSPSLTGVPSTSSASSVASTYASNHAYPAWSPPNQANASYAFHQGSGSAQSYQPGQQRTYSPHQNGVRGGPQSQTQESPIPSAPYEVAQSPFQSSAPMSAPGTIATMGPPPHHHLPSPQQHPTPMMGSSTPVSSAAGPSPVHAQEQFRAPPNTQYYSHQQSNTPHNSYSYSTGPSPTLATPLSAGPMTSRTQMSPATPGPLSAPPVGHYPGRTFSAGYANGPPQHGPVLSNLNNPGGPPMLVGNLPQGMMNFNSGHAAHLQHMYNNAPHAPSQPAHNDRPFKCDQCPQSFNRNHDLKRHKRIHLAVKPFPCGHCDKSFSRKDALKRHILVKGCGKAQAEAEAKKGDGQTTDVKAEKHDVKPVVPS